MNSAPSSPRVPVRLVFLSLAALWACYFIIATMRGAFMGIDFGWAVMSRRLMICVISIFIMAAVYPLLQLLDRRSGATRFILVLIGAFPLSLALSVVNDVFFSDINIAAFSQDEEGDAMAKNLRISRDEAGNILIDMPQHTKQNEPVVEATDFVDPEGASTHSSVPEGHSAITIESSSTALGLGKWRWVSIVDTTFSRYFLVLAWAALYFALAKAEAARLAERREGEYRRAAEAAELRSLRYQVNPHFLFNTLNSLSALVMMGRQDDAEEMIQNLSTFYRQTLSGDATSDIALRDEIEMQRLYFAIEAVRFPDRLLTEIEVEDSVSDAKIPSLILQPLIENSVKYAVTATQRPVTISIEAFADVNPRTGAEQLVLVVKDNGPGTPPSHVDGIGIGLVNVRDRLRTRYGDRASMTYGSAPDGGYITTLRLPLEMGTSVNRTLEKRIV